eukprot:1160108-Pelagomonas_calceolata.AAC.3
MHGTGLAEALHSRDLCKVQACDQATLQPWIVQGSSMHPGSTCSRPARADTRTAHIVSVMMHALCGCSSSKPVVLIQAWLTLLLTLCNHRAGTAAAVHLRGGRVPGPRDCAPGPLLRARPLQAHALECGIL